VIHSWTTFYNAYLRKNYPAHEAAARADAWEQETREACARHESILRAAPTLPAQAEGRAEQE